MLIALQVQASLRAVVPAQEYVDDYATIQPAARLPVGAKRGAAEDHLP
jgi:hypothetical protein